MRKICGKHVLTISFENKIIKKIGMEYLQIIHLKKISRQIVLRYDVKMTLKRSTSLIIQ